MPNEVFHLTTVTRVLADDIGLVDALGFPEISALGEGEPDRRRCLTAKAKQLLEDPQLAPALTLHRRRRVAAVERDELELVFEPPKRSPAWQQAVTVVIHYLRWEEEDLHHAFVPALGLRVFATRATLIPDRVRQHVRLVLTGRGQALTLHRLATLAGIQSVDGGQVEVGARRKSPKEIAVAEAATGETASVLEAMAEEWTRPASTAAPAMAFEVDAELSQLAELLSGPHGRSVLLVGPPGCGKTALARELARRRRDFGLGHTPFWSTSGARLMTGPVGFGMWQERCQQMVRELIKAGAILHLSNLAELLEVGRASRGDQSLGSFLRPWLARGELTVMAECTPEQLGVMERREPHLLAAFLPLTFPERSPQQTRVILDQVLRASPGLAPPDPVAARAALDRLQQLHQRYATYSANPGRPLRFLKNLLADQFPQKAITEAQVLAGFSRETGLPALLLDDEVPLGIEFTRDWFGQRVMGQPEAGLRVVDLLAVIKARLARPRKPLASFLFIGPTGTGKTEMAKALAEFLFGDPARLVRFDLNEFSEPVSVQRLIGGPATGEAEGLLTARVREQPFSVILLDEFEKADPAFFDLLLQVLGDGRLTDAAGRVADFCNSVVVMTSNLGAQGFQRGLAGFRADPTLTSDAREHFTDAVRKFLRPEIFNRLDAIVPFQPLAPDVVLAIARRHLDLVRQRDGLRLRPVDLRIEPGVPPHLAARGYDVRYGARPLKRTIERELLVPLAEALNAYQQDTPLNAWIGLRDGRLQVRVTARPDGQASDAGTRPLAEAIMDERRRVGQLQRGSAVGRIEDEVAMIESLARRQAGGGWKSPETQTRLARLPRLRECLGALRLLGERSERLETEALVTAYRREPLERDLIEPELDALRLERARLRREVFRQQQEEPDEVVLAVYCEHRETMFALAAAYHDLANRLGRVLGLDFFQPPPGGRSSGASPVRVTPPQPADFLTKPPEKVLGIVMHLRGDLFRPRFGPEAGLQVLKEPKADHVALIESAPLPFSHYRLPAGIERAGGIKALGAAVIRTFDRANDSVTDGILGERPWNGGALTRCLEVLTSERLERAIEEATA